MATIKINIGLRRGKEYAGLTCQAMTQKEVVDLIKSTLDAQGISHFVKCRITEIEVRPIVDNKKGKTIYFSFRGLSPKQIRNVMVQQIPQSHISDRSLTRIKKS